MSARRAGRTGTRGVVADVVIRVGRRRVLQALVRRMCSLAWRWARRAQGRCGGAIASPLPLRTVTWVPDNDVLADLADDRLYLRAEAAAILGMSSLTLRDLVTRASVPHVRLGSRKGVRFTAANIRDIARARAVGVTRSVDDETRAGARADLSAFAGLRTARRRP